MAQRRLCYSIILYCFILFFMSCGKGDKHVIENKFITKNLLVQWYYYDLWKGDHSLFYIDLLDSKGNTLQNLYEGDLVCTLDVTNDTLTILKEPGGGIVRKNLANSYGVEVFLDETCQGPSLYHHQP